MKTTFYRIFSFLFFFIFCVSMTLAQTTGQVKGRVMTSDGKYAQYVNVGLKGTTKGTMTSSEGKYEIRKVEPGAYILIVSFVGLETQQQEIEVKAGETSPVPDIILKENSQQLKEVVVTSSSTFYPKKESDYVAKLPLKNIENPQVYNTISSELLKDQVITNFDDALLNAPGIEKRWESTGRGGDGSSYYSLRGFESQATMVNGLPGLTNGSLDPANIDRIEIIKGPSGTLYGSSLISYGGIVNTVTKRPYNTFGGEVSYIAGSFGLNRITADINAPLSIEKGLFLRVNTAYHSENSFQDAGFKKSLFFAPSLLYNVNERLTFWVNTEFMDAEGTNAPMLFLNRSKPVEYRDMEDLNYNNKLSMTGNDITIKNPRYNLQAQMNYKISDNWTSQTALSRGSARSDGFYSYLWDNGDGVRQFSLFINDQNSQTVTTDIQQNFIGDLQIGKFRNRVVIGLDYFLRQVTDNSSGYGRLLNITPQGEINNVDPYTGDTLADNSFSRQSVDALLANSTRNRSNVKDQTYSAYVSDVFNITPRLLAMASLRIDYFDTEGDILTKEDDYNQTTLSPKFGILYQAIQDKVSVFANYMNGFKNVAPIRRFDQNSNTWLVQTFEAEHANQLEFGVKTSLFENRVISNVSYYTTTVSNKLMADPNNVDNSIQGGEVESQGFEVDVNASPIIGLNIIAGYSYNDSKVLKGPEDDLWFGAGRRPAEAGSKNLFNFWATYRLTQGTLKGFGVGFGANAASEMIVIDSEATGKFVLPGYTVLNSSLFYNSDAFRINLNVNNFTDKEYYKGYSTINPQKPRNVTASIAYKF